MYVVFNGPHEVFLSGVGAWEPGEVKAVPDEFGEHLVKRADFDAVEAEDNAVAVENEKEPAEEKAAPKQRTKAPAEAE